MIERKAWLLAEEKKKKKKRKKKKKKKKKKTVAARKGRDRVHGSRSKRRSRGTAAVL